MQLPWLADFFAPLPPVAPARAAVEPEAAPPAPETPAAARAALSGPAPARTPRETRRSSADVMAELGRCSRRYGVRGPSPLDAWSPGGRVSRILTLPEAAGRTEAALYLAHRTNASVEDARTALAMLPESTRAAPDDPAEAAALVICRPDQASRPHAATTLDRAIAAVNRRPASPFGFPAPPPAKP